MHSPRDVYCDLYTPLTECVDGLVQKPEAGHAGINETMAVYKTYFNIKFIIKSLVNFKRSLFKYILCQF